jgi:hypothetical protein
MKTFSTSGTAADLTLALDDRLDGPPGESATQPQASRDRRRHEALGEPLGPQEAGQPTALELAALLEAGLTEQQINQLVFTRWAIGGPRSGHTIPLSWEGERTGLLARLAGR